MNALTLNEDIIQSPNGIAVPRHGWNCLWVTDLKDEYGEYERETCEYCGYNALRFVHTLGNPKLDYQLKTGCCCAASLCEDYDAEEAERKLKNRFSRKERWLTRKWKNSQRGNQYLIIDGYHIGVFQNTFGRWGYWINHKFCDLQYRAEGEAKLALFDALADNLGW